MSSAIQLIRIEPGETKNSPLVCCVTNEAKEFLSNCSQDLAVISCTGPFRGGKSFLLSRLLNPETSTNMFTTSASVQACTRGIWVSPMLLEKRILLMDTEGLNAPGSTETIDTNILAFSILLSSLLLFSTKSRIDTAAFDSLQSAVVMARWFADQMQKTEATMEGEEEEEGEEQELTNDEARQAYALSKPSLIWLLRDFELGLEGLTPNQYLEQQLQKCEPSLRNSLDQLFESRTCITMCEPVVNKVHLQNMHPSNLTPGFKRDFDNVRRAVLQTQPQQIQGRNVNGAVILALAENLCAILSKPGTPQLAPMWKAAALAASSEMRKQITKQFAVKLQAKYSPVPKVTFWTTEELKDQMTQALSVWAEKQAYSQPDEAIVMLTEFWNIVNQSSQEKTETWKTALLKDQSSPTKAEESDASDSEDDDDHKTAKPLLATHLLPLELREVIMPLFTECLQLKQKLSEAQARLEQTEADFASSREALASNAVLACNSEELLHAQAALAAVTTELQEFQATHDKFRDLAVEKAEAQKALIEEQRVEIFGLKASIGKLGEVSRAAKLAKRKLKTENKHLLEERKSDCGKRQKVDDALNLSAERLKQVQAQNLVYSSSNARLQESNAELRRAITEAKMLAATRGL